MGLAQMTRTRRSADDAGRRRWVPRALAWVAVALAAGCGARTSLVDADVGGDGGGAATNVASGAGGDGAGRGEGGAEGGGPPSTACDRLVWAGDAALVGGDVAVAARHPQLVSLGDDRVALAYVEVEPDGDAAMHHRAVEAWGVWPPVVSAPAERGVEIRLVEPAIAVAPVDADALAFAVSSDPSNIALGRARPGDPARVITMIVRTTPAVRWLSEPLAPDLHLVGHGPASALLVDLVPLDGRGPIPLGALGCTSAPLASDATRVAGGVLVASANGTPFDDCIDPDAPLEPRIVQTVLVHADGAVEPAGSIEAGGIVEQVLLAPRDGGAWLGWRIDADDYAHVVPVDETGAPEPAGLSWGVPPAHAIAVRGRGPDLVLVESGPGGEAGVAVRVHLLDGAFAHLAATAAAPPGVSAVQGESAVLVSPDGRSFLVAVAIADAAGAPLALVRADCAP